MTGHSHQIALFGVFLALGSATAAGAEEDCEIILNALNAHLTEQRIAQNDESTLEAWQEARPRCEAGDSEEAVEVLNRALSEIGAPPIPTAYLDEAHPVQQEGSGG